MIRRLERRTLITLAVFWAAFSIVVLECTRVCDTPLLAFLFFLSSAIWFLLFAPLTDSPRLAKHLEGREWSFPRTMCILPFALPPIILLEALLRTPMATFLYGPVIVGFLVGWKARSSWIALYATLLSALISATVMVLCFYVRPWIPDSILIATAAGKTAGIGTVNRFV